MTASDKVKKEIRSALKRLKIPVHTLDIECCRQGYTGLVMFLRRDKADIGVNKVASIEKAIRVLTIRAGK